MSEPGEPKEAAPAPARRQRTPRARTPRPKGGARSGRATAASSAATRWRIAAALVLLAVAFGAGWFAPAFVPQLAAIVPTGPTPSEEASARRMSELEARVAAAESWRQALDATERRLAALEAALGELATERAQAEEVAVDAAQVAALGEHLASFEARLDAELENNDVAVFAVRLRALETALEGVRPATEAVVAIRTEVGRLTVLLDASNTRLGVLEAEIEPGRLRAAALALAVGQLRQAVAAGSAYGAELRSVSVLGRGDERVSAALDTLAPRAEAGVPTLAALRARFGAIAGTLVHAARGEGGSGWVDNTLDRLGAVVSVRRTGIVAGDAIDARIARAEAWLANGDLAAAVSEVTELAKASGAAAAAADDWLIEARARLAAERAMADLGSLIVATLSGQAGP